MGTRSKNLCVCYVISKNVKRIDGKIETSTVGYKFIRKKERSKLRSFTIFYKLIVVCCNI